MNGVPMQGSDDLRARVALACAGYNLSRSVSETVRIHGPQAVMGALTIPQRVLDRADEVLAVSYRSGLTVLTPVSPMRPWNRTTLELPAPLVVWAKGQLDVLKEPLIRVSRNPDMRAPVDSEWAAVEVATALSDAGHVLIAGTDTGRDQLVLRAARGMGGRWVSVSADLLRDFDLGPLGSAARGVVVSAAPPGVNLRGRSNRDAQELLSRLTSITVDPLSGWPTPDSPQAQVAGLIRVLR